VAFFREFAVERRPEWFAREEAPQAGAPPRDANVLCRVLGPGWVAAPGVTTEGRIARFWPAGSVGRFAEATIAGRSRFFERAAAVVEAGRPAPPIVATQLPPAAPAAVAPAVAAPEPSMAARPAWLRCRVVGGRTVNCEGWSLDDRRAHHWPPGTVAYFAEPTVQRFSAVLIPEPEAQEEPKPRSAPESAPVERRASPTPEIAGDPAPWLSEGEPRPSGRESGATSVARDEPIAPLRGEEGRTGANMEPIGRDAASEPQPTTATPATAQPLAGGRVDLARDTAPEPKDSAYGAEADRSDGCDEDVEPPSDAAPPARESTGPRPPDRPTPPRVRQRAAREGPSS
jgi:hypothetical protein